MALSLTINKVNVAASFAAGATVANAVASGGTAPYVYSLATGGDKFAINSSTGAVTTIANMDASNIASFSVTATDSTTGTPLTITSDITYPPIQAAIQNKFNKNNVIYKITKFINLYGGVLTIPEGCTLDFQGGAIVNGNIIFNNTLLKGDVLFTDDISISGDILNSEFLVDWFGVKGDKITDDTINLQRAINVAASYTKPLILGNGSYRITNTLRVKSGTYLKGNGSLNSYARNTAKNFSSTIYADFADGSQKWIIETSNYNSQTGEYLPYNVFLEGEGIHYNGYDVCTSLTIEGIHITSNYDRPVVYGGIKLVYAPTSTLRDISIQGHIGTGIVRNAQWTFADYNITIFTHFYGYVCTRDVNAGTILNVTVRIDPDNKLNLADYQEYIIPGVDNTNNSDEHYKGVLHFANNYNTYSKGFAFVNDVNNLSIIGEIELADCAVYLNNAKSVKFLSLYYENTVKTGIAGAYCKFSAENIHVYSLGNTILDMGFNAIMNLSFVGQLTFSNFSYRDSIVDTDNSEYNESYLWVKGWNPPVFNFTYPRNRVFFYKYAVQQNSMYASFNTASVSNRGIDENTVFADVTTESIDYVLAPAGNNLGRTVTIVINSNDTHTFNISHTDGEYLFDGNNSFTEINNVFLNPSNINTLVAVNFSGKIGWVLYRTPVKYNIGKGTTSGRPTLGSSDYGYLYYDNELMKYITWSGITWMNVDGTPLT